MSNVSVIKIFLSKRMLVMLLLGFWSGLPIALTSGTLQAWLSDEGIDIKLIGIFSSVTLPYSLKFLWSPLLDRYAPSFSGKTFLGRRRGWIFLSQVLLGFSIFGLGLGNPSENIQNIAYFALLVAFFSASQDVVVDAYRTELLTKEEFGPAVSVFVVGYRLAMLTSGAGALVLADYYPWESVYSLMAIIMALGILCTLFAPEPTLKETPPKNIKDAVFLPLVDYFKMKGAFEMLVFIVLYKIGDVMAATLTTKFMLDVGFSKSEIGVVTKGFGLIATIVGGLLGGGLLLRLSMKQALIFFGVLQGVSTLCFSLLANVGKNDGVMAATIGIENLCGGLGNAAFLAFLMGLCNKRFTATQYALLTSLAAVTRTLAGVPTGYIVDTIGWSLFFVVCTVAAIPGILLVAWRYEHWENS